MFLTLLLNVDCGKSFASMSQFKSVPTMYLLSKGKSNYNFQMKMSFYNRKKSNLGYKVMRVNTMLQKVPFCRVHFCSPDQLQKGYTVFRIGVKSFTRKW